MTSTGGHQYHLVQYSLASGVREKLRSPRPIPRPLIGMWAAGVVVVAVLGLVGPTAVDEVVWQWWIRHRVEAFNQPMRIMAQFTAPRILIPTALILSCLGVILRPALRRWAWRAAGLGMLTLLAAQAASIMLKVVFHHPRPPQDEQLIVVPLWSFPSGHTLIASAVAAIAVAAVVAERTVVGTTWISGQLCRWLTTTLGAVFACAVGMNRLYMGAHWLSDVVAGWVLGVMAGLFVWWLLVRRYPKGA